jgi:hypothetical protein
VIAARVGIGVRSDERAGERLAQTFPVSRVNVSGPADGRFRQGFNTSIALRNTLRVVDN